jgi:hypothetical protein
MPKVVGISRFMPMRQRPILYGGIGTTWPMCGAITGAGADRVGFGTK